MSFHHQAKIVNDGLVMYLDAKNQSTSTSWKNLKGADATVSSALFNPEGFYICPSTGSTITHPWYSCPSTAEWTLSQWQYVKYVGPVVNPNYRWEHIAGHNLTGDLYSGYWMWHDAKLVYYQDYINPEYYGTIGAGAFSLRLGTHIEFDKWFNLTIRYDPIDVAVTAIINGNEYFETRNISWSPRVTSFAFDKVTRINTAGIYFDGNFATHMIYNRYLSDSEILQNYNALKSRFGL